MKSKKLSYNKILILFCIIVVLVLMTGCREIQPIIYYFSADPSTIYPGENSILSWSASLCHVEITPDVGTVDPSGSTIVSPAVTTRYVLIVTNTWAEFVTAELTVTVVAIPLNGLHGSININSTPPGAEIHLDGENTGETTPTTLTTVEVGEHIITLILQGYQDWQSMVTVNDDQITDVNAILILAPCPGF